MSENPAPIQVKSSGTFESSTYNATCSLCEWVAEGSASVPEIHALIEAHQDEHA